jgi:uncharacterized protein YegP (UPF0339 family)
MKIEIYEDKALEWRWRLRAPNGRILADGAEGYSTKAGVRRSVANFVKYLIAAVPVEEVRVRAETVEVKKPKITVRRPSAAARVRARISTMISRA